MSGKDALRNVEPKSLGIPELKVTIKQLLASVQKINIQLEFHDSRGDFYDEDWRSGAMHAKSKLNETKQRCLDELYLRKLTAHEAYLNSFGVRFVDNAKEMLTDALFEEIVKATKQEKSSYEA